MLSAEVQVNGDKLRQLREARGWGWAQIAKLSSLSVSQVRALETGSTQCFYSLRIKNAAARKVSQVLGVAESEVITVCEAPSTPLEELANRVTAPGLVAVNRWHLSSSPHPSSWMGYGVMVLGMVAAVVWSGVRPATAPSMPKGLQTAAPVTLPKEQASPEPREFEMVPAALTTAVDSACPFEADTAVMQAKKPSKSAAQISLMPRQAGELCVQDGTGKVWREALKPGAWSTFNGQAPWTIYSLALPYADVFFQGEKIRPAATPLHTMALSGKLFNH